MAPSLSDAVREIPRIGKFGKGASKPVSIAPAQKQQHHKLSAFPCSCFEVLLEDNPHIVEGHRSHATGNFMACTASVFQLHNDTFNIWTHALGALFWPYIYYCFVRDDTGGHSSDLERAGLFVFCMFVSIGLFASAVYHTFRVYSVTYYVNTLIMDLMGVLLQLACCIGLIVYYEFNCWPAQQKLYLAVTFVLGLAACVATPHFVYTRNHALRTTSFGLLAGIGLMAWIHHFALTGFALNTYNWKTLLGLLEAYGWVIAGLLVRRLRAPECFSRGRFNIWFSSHQIFHVMVFMTPFTVFQTFVMLRNEGVLHTCGLGPFDF